MVHNRTTNFWNLAAQFFLGSSTLASVAFLRLGVDLASIAFVYLIVTCCSPFVSSLITLSGTSEEND